MKTLLLLRHAKSSWDDPDLADDKRPLAARGRETAPRMGKEVAIRGWRPGRALVSPAARTRETWDLVAAELPDAPEEIFAEGLYMGTPEQLLAELKQTPEEVTTLLVIGHNPGLEALAKRLASADSNKAALARMEKKFPTAALAAFTFDETWADLRFGKAKLIEFLKPKDLD